MFENTNVAYLVFNRRNGLANLCGNGGAGRTDFDAVVADIQSGKYDDPNRIVAFNLDEGLAWDVTLLVSVIRNHLGASDP